MCNQRCFSLLVILSVVLVSGCTNGDTVESQKPTTVENIPKQTDLFPENYDTVTVGEESYYRYKGDIIYLLKGIRSSSDSLKLEYSKGEFDIPANSNFAEIDGKLAWEDNGKIYLDGEEIVEGELPFEVEGDLGFVNSTFEGDKISVYNSSLPRFEQDNGISINQVSYSDGFFYSTSGYAGGEKAIFRNGEKLLGEGYIGELRTSNGEAYITSSETESEANGTSGPLEQHKYYKATKAGAELLDLGLKNPIYVINLENYQEVWKGNKTIERFNLVDMAVNDAEQTDSGTAYAIEKIERTEEGEYKSRGNKYVYLNESYYGPYKEIFGFEEVNGSLVYQAEPVGQDRTFLVTKDSKDWFYS